MIIMVTDTVMTIMDMMMIILRIQIPDVIHINTVMMQKMQR